MSSATPISTSTAWLGRRNCLDPRRVSIFGPPAWQPGMRVLDVGSGTGDVAFLAADFVGPSGEVVWHRYSSGRISAARDAAIARGQAQVSFREGNPAEMVFEGSFDFVVGRFVLHHQADPSGMLRGLAKHLRPGGVILFHEPIGVSCDPNRQCRPMTVAAAGSSTSSIAPAPVLPTRVRGYIGPFLPPAYPRRRCTCGRLSVML